MNNRLVRSAALVFISYWLLIMPLPQGLALDELPFPDPEITISMDLQDANLNDILKIFSIQSGLNFIASEAVQNRKVTLYLDKTPIKEAMDKIFKANNLAYDLDVDSNIFIVKDLGKPEAETVTKVFYLKYASVTGSRMKKDFESNLGLTAGGDIQAAIRDVLTGRGKVSEDVKTNSLIVTDVAANFKVIEQVIARLDIRVPQILIEIEMLDVSKNTVDAMGFDFASSPFTMIFSKGHLFGQGAKWFLGDTNLIRQTDIGGATGAGAGSIIMGRNYGEVLEFLRTQTDTKSLARPRLITLNNETAEIQITTQESIGVDTTTSSTAGTTTAEPERSETGVSLRVTPQINEETGEITMFIYPRVSEAVQGNAITSGGQQFVFRDPEERSTKSTVRIMDGDTVILGGLIRNDLSVTSKKVPFLGDIPVLGALFRHKNKTRDRERELLVFITPHIIKDPSTSRQTRQAQAGSYSMPKREQTATSLFDRQAIISSSLNNFDTIQ